MHISLNDERSPKPECRKISVVRRQFCHSDLGIAVCSIKRPDSGLSRAAGGGSVHGDALAAMPGRRRKTASPERPAFIYHLTAPAAVLLHL
jgi:hypothetical protein